MAKFHVEMLGNSEVPEIRSIELKSRSIDLGQNSIDRFFPELTVAEVRQNAQLGASP
jgi:hypothetical protein